MLALSAPAPVDAGPERVQHCAIARSAGVPKRTTEHQKRLARESAARVRARARGEDVPLRTPPRVPDDQLTPEQLRKRLLDRANQARYRVKQREKLDLGVPNKDKTHCGTCSLPYDEANTAYAKDGSRRCRNCHNNQVKAAYAADPEAGRARSRDKWARHGDDYNRRDREQRVIDPEGVRAADRDRYAASPRKKNNIKYNRLKITEAEWLKMFEAQGGCCYLCGQDLGENSKHIHIDHDHRCCPATRSCSKCRRGLACNRCNVIAGWARDDANYLRMIADNLEMAVLIVTERLREEETCRI